MSRKFTQTFSMSIAWIDPLKKIAKEQDVSVSSLICEAIAEHCKRKQFDLPKA